jgi:hypothetical protein
VHCCKDTVAVVVRGLAVQCSVSLVHCSGMLVLIVCTWVAWRLGDNNGGWQMVVLLAVIMHQGDALEWDKL